MKALAAVALVAALALAACHRSPESNRGVTFNKDVAPILFGNCASCHRPGEAGPFSLLTYQDAAKRARRIAEVTRDRHMPPWLPERGDFPLLGERRLPEADIDIIQRWVAAGMPEGNPAELPPQPAWTDGWQIGKPDVI